MQLFTTISYKDFFFLVSCNESVEIAKPKKNQPLFAYKKKKKKEIKNRFTGFN